MTSHWPVDRLAIVDSTNSEAKRRAAASGFDDHWILADQQTSGRGREDHVWLSPAGNLFATALFVEPRGLQVALRLPFAVALAVSDTVRAMVPRAAVDLKWPNDVRVGRKKISGILIETGRTGGSIWVAAGIGVNVRLTPEGIGQPATSLVELGANPAISPSDVFERLHQCFSERLTEARRGFASIREAWLHQAEGLGEMVTVSVGGQQVYGVFETLDTDGGLVLQLPNGERRTIRAGEINLPGGS